jgi:hypothetical protein
MKNLAEAEMTTTMVKKDTIVIEQGGSVKRITFDNLLASINSGDEQILRQVAWGVPLESNTSGEWGVIGNTTLRDEWNNSKRRHLLTNAGIAAPLASGDSSIYADGTTLDVSKGHIMTKKPRIYYDVKPNELDGLNYLWMSTVPIGSQYIDDIWVGSFLGYLRNGALTSIPDVVPTQARTINQYWADAQVNGKYFGITNYNYRRYLMMECLSDYGSPNIQTKLGCGVGGSAGNQLYNGDLTTGSTVSLGNKSGYVTISGDSCHTSIHGDEDTYSALWEFQQGIYCGNSGNSAQDGTEVFVYEGNRLPNSTELTTQPNGEYRKFTRLASVSNSPIQKMVLGEYFDLFPKTLGGTTSQNWCDAAWANPTGQVLIWGGSFVSGSSSGLGYASSEAAWSSTSAYRGARLAYYGDVTIVDGKDIA